MKVAWQTRALKNSAGADGGLNGGESVRRPGSKDPHWGQQNKYFVIVQIMRKNARLKLAFNTLTLNNRDKQNSILPHFMLIF